MSAAAWNASSASNAWPARWRTTPSSSNISARAAGSSVLRSSAVRSNSAASPWASTSVAARAASTLYSIARSTPPSGTAAAK